ncbi:MAG: carbohydrate ABC transporter permease [Desulfobacterales bacterium]|nr:MAG: carbohydrate ABC transporter permease [Desulfobacterales bacterium]
MRKLTHYTLNVVTFIIAGLVFFPIAWTALTGLKTEPDALAIPPIFAFRPDFSTYMTLLQSGDYFHYLSNSALIVVLSTLTALAFGLPAAYTMAFHAGKNADRALFFVLSTRFMPTVGLIVPLYILYARLWLLDSHVGLMILYTALGLPVAIWLMRSFFAEIPFAIIEAAMIDGAGHASIFWRIVLPLSIPGLFTTSILIAIFAWNEFFFAVNLTTYKAATLPVYMASFFTTEGLSWAKMSAAATLSLLPILILGWSVQRSLVRGLTFGAFK